MSPERTATSQPLTATWATPFAPVVSPRTAVGRTRGRTHRRPAAPRVARTALLLVDGAAALTGGALALAAEQRHPLLIAAFVAALAVLNGQAGLYRSAEPRLLLDDCPAIAARIAVLWCALAALLAGLPQLAPVPVKALAAGCALHGLLTIAGRGLVYGRHRAAVARHPAAALLIGPQMTAPRVAAALLRQPASGVRPVGIVAPAAPGARQQAATSTAVYTRGPQLPVLTTVDDVRRAVIQNGVRRALLMGSPSAPEHQPWLRALGELHCEVWQLDTPPSPYVLHPDRGAPRHLAGFPSRPVAVMPRRYHPGKRALDLLVSGALLVLTSPVLLVCALWLRLSEGPGVVFRQERIGKDGRPFTLLKFRTHRPADPMESATRWSVADERQMAWFCRFLRRSSLDELLQLWNVFRGDMSLVGPRPERPYFVAKFSESHPGYAARHRMPTGITGLAQINGLRGDTSIEDRCRFDNAYIDSWSLWRDISILLRTAASLIRPTGS
ncbi:exopolysaccharide biosynthesis polyprenyl glycosylphosphotransferase [Streptomyces apocyni]|uniref:exopolysaccharide biosynthesis polyprenyl glycosylphosphotransferase n=1 Tax=Streptomyces apocyni TaxID=2654677 RepID=UPI0012EABF92|nr:exopolysaccharide biosynthesis polyprenyl glycosylphosphotransferase [Streptomyces apocyni]